jgi:hypothetical protein
MEADKDT